MKINIDTNKFNADTKNYTSKGVVFNILYFLILSISYYFGVSWTFYVFAGFAYLSLILAPLAVWFTVYITYTRNPALVGIDPFQLKVTSLFGYACVYLTYLQSQQINSNFMYYAVIISLTSSVSVLISLIYRDSVADKMRKEIKN